MAGGADGLLDVVRASGHLPVAICDRGGRVGGPANGDALVADDDVWVVVGGVGDLGDAIHEGDPVQIGFEAELPFKRAVDLAPPFELVHEAEYATPEGYA